MLLMLPLPAALAAFAAWRLLKRTRLPLWGRLLLSAALGIGAAALLFWGTIYLSILAFLWNDPVNW